MAAHVGPQGQNHRMDDRPHGGARARTLPGAAAGGLPSHPQPAQGRAARASVGGAVAARVPDGKGPGRTRPVDDALAGVPTQAPPEEATVPRRTRPPSPRTRAPPQPPRRRSDLEGLTTLTRARALSLETLREKMGAQHVDIELGCRRMGASGCEESGLAPFFAALNELREDRRRHAGAGGAPGRLADRLGPHHGHDPGAAPGAARLGRQGASSTLTGPRARGARCARARRARAGRSAGSSTATIRRTGWAARAWPSPPAGTGTPTRALPGGGRALRRSCSS